MLLPNNNIFWKWNPVAEEWELPQLESYDSNADINLDSKTVADNERLIALREKEKENNCIDKSLKLDIILAKINKQYGEALKKLGD